MTPDASARIGPYRIVETLGEGGMGVVYLAEQSEPVQRQVALKLLKPGADSAHVLARFEAERQALAVMDHPSIAKVFDAGVTPDGRSYFVMELVTGASLADYCDERRLDIKQRVGLLVDVCLAVQHAHQKGVIHRDLKPSNVLVSDVDGRPLPRIIDFGIAKATETAQFDGTSLTRSDQTIGTPAYMSPEQIDGLGDVDTRTDIYALGVLLFEILVGALPYDQKAYRGWAAVAAQLTRDPPTLATRLTELADAQDAIASLRSTTPALLKREVRGDLGHIVSRAMDKDRERRYETANAFALDLRRFLSHEPVRARGGARSYVLGRFVRRNRVSVAFGVTVVLGLVGFSVVTTVQADRIARARDEADTRRGQAEGLVDFMLGDLRDKLEPIGRLDVLNDVGDQALSYFSSLPEGLFSEDELLSRSQALYQIGSVRLSEGRLPAADTAFAESLRLARELSTRDASSNEWLFGMGQAEFWVGELARRRGNLDGAMEHFEVYRDISFELAERDSADLTYLMERGYSHTNVGAVLRSRGAFEAALVEFQAALEVKQRVVDAEPSRGNRYDLSRSYNTIGIVLSDLGRLNDARAFLASDVELKEALLDETPGNATFGVRLSVSLLFLGELLWASGELEEALADFQRAESLIEPLVQRDPENAVGRRRLVTTRGWLASLLVELDRSSEALSILSEDVPVMEALSSANPEELAWRVDVADQHRRLGQVHLRMGRIGAAEESALAALTVLERLVDAQGWDAASRRAQMGSLLLLGDALAEDGRVEQARSYWDEATALAREATGPNPHRLDREIQAEGLYRLERPDEAAALLTELTSGGFARPALMRLAVGAGFTGG